MFVIDCDDRTLCQREAHSEKSDAWHAGQMCTFFFVELWRTKEIALETEQASRPTSRRYSCHVFAYNHSSACLFDSIVRDVACIITTAEENVTCLAMCGSPRLLACVRAYTNTCAGAGLLLCARVSCVWRLGGCDRGFLGNNLGNNLGHNQGKAQANHSSKQSKEAKEAKHSKA